MRSNIMVPIERSCHIEHTYEISITLSFKGDLAIVKVVADKQTDRPKTM
jgi:hypothetical protein